MNDQRLTSKQQSALDALAKCKDSLTRIQEKGLDSARLNRWRMTTGRIIGEEVDESEAGNFLSVEVPRQQSGVGASLSLLAFGSYITDRHKFIDALAEAIDENPELFFRESAAKEDKSDVALESAVSTNVTKKAVYIMFGSDRANANDLKTMLHEWGIEARFLSDDASGSKTLREMLEDSRTRASFVFVLLTPDDRVKMSAWRSYWQPRPNALIELGYYLSYLGRDRVVMVCKENLLKNISSNLGGIRATTFHRTVRDAAIDIQKELAAVGLGPLAKTDK